MESVNNWQSRWQKDSVNAFTIETRNNSWSIESNFEWICFARGSWCEIFTGNWSIHEYAYFISNPKFSSTFLLFFRRTKLSANNSFPDMWSRPIENRTSNWWMSVHSSTNQTIIQQRLLQTSFLRYLSFNAICPHSIFVIMQIIFMLLISIFESLLQTTRCSRFRHVLTVVTLSFVILNQERVFPHIDIFTFANIMLLI